MSLKVKFLFLALSIVYSVCVLSQCREVLRHATVVVRMQLGHLDAKCSMYFDLCWNYTHTLRLCHDFSLNWVFNSDIVAFYQANNLILHFQWLQLKCSLYVLMYMFTASCPWFSKSSGLCEHSYSIFSGQNMSRSLCCWHTNSKA